MGGTCNAHGRDEKCTQNSGRKTRRGTDHSEDLGVNGRIILE
jgi:hypothetical protein